jgi:hypothetical protein
MARLCLVAVDRPGLAPFPVTPRLRTQLVYFATPPGSPGAPALGENEHWFATADAARFLDEGVISLISPLDTANMTEVEISEEQESLLGWLTSNGIQHIRVVE